MKLLVITYSFPPATTPRAYRWGSLVEYWGAQGHEVDVVTSRVENLSSVQYSGKVGVFRCFSLSSTGSLLKSRLSVQKSNSYKANLKQFVLNILKSLHSNTVRVIRWPDYACTWLIPAVWRALRLMSTRDYDAFISVSHPFTGHLVGWLVHWFFPKKHWMVDIGDPFALFEEIPQNNLKLYRRLNYFIERQIITAASSLSVTTEGTRLAYKKAFPNIQKEYVVIPPLIGVAQQESKAKSNSDGVINLVYQGTLYRELRNPRGMLQTLNVLVRNSSLKFRLHLYGQINDCQPVLDEFQHLIGNNIALHGSVSKSLANEAMQNADVLINIGNKTSYQLPSKIVDYMALGKPILNFASVRPDSSEEVLREYTRSLTFHDGDWADKKKIEKLEKFLLDPPPIPAQDLAKILAKFRIEHIAQKYVSLIDAKHHG